MIAGSKIVLDGDLVVRLWRNGRIAVIVVGIGCIGGVVLLVTDKLSNVRVKVPRRYGRIFNPAGSLPDKQFLS